MKKKNKKKLEPKQGKVYIVMETQIENGEIIIPTLKRNDEVEVKISNEK